MTKTTFKLYAPDDSNFYVNVEFDYLLMRVNKVKISFTNLEGFNGIKAVDAAKELTNQNSQYSADIYSLDPKDSTGCTVLLNPKAYFGYMKNAIKAGQFNKLEERMGAILYEYMFSDIMEVMGYEGQGSNEFGYVLNNMIMPSMGAYVASRKKTTFLLLILGIALLVGGIVMGVSGKDGALGTFGVLLAIAGGLLAVYYLFQFLHYKKRDEIGR